MAGLADLKRRVEEARGPDTNLDVALWCLDPTDPEEESAIPSYTASLDAAVTLVERAAPGWTWRVDGGHGSRPGSDLWLRPNEYYDGTGATPALAVLSGLLAVLLANPEPGA